jgi:hypothetical protein
VPAAFSFPKKDTTVTYSRFKETLTRAGLFALHFGLGASQKPKGKTTFLRGPASIGECAGGSSGRLFHNR